MVNASHPCAVHEQNYKSTAAAGLRRGCMTGEERTLNCPSRTSAPLKASPSSVHLTPSFFLHLSSSFFFFILLSTSSFFFFLLLLSSSFFLFFLLLSSSFFFFLPFSSFLSTSSFFLFLLFFLLLLSSSFFIFLLLSPSIVVVLGRGAHDGEDGAAGARGQQALHTQRARRAAGAEHHHRARRHLRQAPEVVAEVVGESRCGTCGRPT
mgnify:CR=1 FL=1